MKNLRLYFVVLFFAVFTACDYVEFDENGQLATAGGESQLMLKSAGIMSGGVINVQQGINTSFMLMSTNANNPLTDASWVIETKDYTGLNITHRFNTLGNVTFAVTAQFQNGTTETRNFSIKVVKDISTFDPVKVFVNGYTTVTSGAWNGYKRYNVTILISKERMANKTMYGYSGNFNDDAQGVWLAGIKIPAGDANYIIENGVPKAVSSDIGKYVAIKLALIPRDYSFAVGEFEKIDGSGAFMWADLSGSSYVKVSENVGIVKIKLNADGTITSLGDGYVAPIVTLGATGDTDAEGVLRYTLANGKLTIYFKLADDFNKLTPFMVIKNQETGVWSEPIALTAVANYTRYGKVELTEASVLNVLTSIRFGNTLNTKVIDYVQMAKSGYYNPDLKELRLTVVKG